MTNELITPGEVLVPVPIITAESGVARVTQTGNRVGIEELKLERSGPGIAVWRFSTDCKRTLVSIGYSGKRVSVILGPQEGEPEWAPHEDTVAEDYGQIELRLPRRESMDHWIVQDVYDKHGGYLIAFLSFGIADFMSADRIKELKGQ
jgi:hypothetical protein